MKLLTHFCLLVIMLGCNSRNEPKNEKDYVALSNEAKQDSLAEVAEEAADRMYAEQKASEEKQNITGSDIVVKDLGWEADQNLNAVRKLFIANNSEKTIIGVFLKSEVVSGSKITATYNYGKFKIKVPITAHATKTLRVPASRIGRDSEVVLNSNLPSWAGLIAKDRLMVNTVIFGDGSFSSFVVNE